MMTERERDLSTSLAIALGALGLSCAVNTVVVAEHGGIGLIVAALGAVAAIAAGVTVGKIVVALRRNA